MAFKLTKVSSLSSLTELGHTLTTSDKLYSSVGTSSLSSAKVTLSEVGGALGANSVYSTVNANSSTWQNSIDGTGSTGYIPKFTGSQMISNSILFDDGDQIAINTTSPSGSDVLTVNGSVFVEGAMRVTGDITSFFSSDARLKDNAVNISNSLDKIEAINGVTFVWNDKSDNEGKDVGVLAHEIEAVLPEVVVTRGDGYKAVRYEKLVPLLIEAIKELSTRVRKLEGSS